MTAAGFNGCSADTLEPVSCGDTLEVTVRLSSGTYDTDGQPACTDEDFGKPAKLSVKVECPTCPEMPKQGDSCDYPRSGRCPTLAYNHWQDTVETVMCACGGWAFPADTPTTWGCPVF